ncbi:MAG: hypothetical protein AB1648_14890 [Pseudomonadota bacterium]|jgi:hypothetical protein
MFSRQNALAITLLRLAGVFLLSVSWALAAERYSSIVDSGSGGSRIYLFMTDTDSNGYPTVTEVPLPDNKVSPGISAFVGDPGKVGPYLQPLINTLTAKLSELGVSQNQVGFSLFATAGMRVESPVSQNAVYQEVTKVVRESTQLDIQHVQTIQGRYEGAFEWLTLNYLKGTLPAKMSDTYGVLEVGGGSFQMSFHSATKSRNALDNVAFQYGPETITLFSRSYTGLGGNYSRYQYTDNQNCFPKDYPLPSGAVGTGRFDRALDAVKKLFNAHRTRISSSVEVPALSRFVGLGAFKDTADFFGIGGKISVNELQSVGKTFAETPWGKLLEKYPNDPYLFLEAYNAAYLSELLDVWFKADEKLPVDGKIDGIKIAWPLGAALFYAANNQMQ